MRIAVPPVDPQALDGHDRTHAIVRLSGETMGTTWRVALAAPPVFDLAPLHAAIITRLAGLVGEMSHWDATSLLCRFNRAAPGSWTRLPPDFARVIACALDIAARSDGAFDPAIGHLVDLWGYGPVVQAGPPTAVAIEAARAVSGWRRLAFADAMLRQPGGLALDLSGIAKGYAVDAIAALIGAHRHDHALVEIGGECAGRGIKPDGDPWWIDCETPPHLALTPLRVALHGLSIATSGDYVRGRHTIDPRTGQQATGVAAVSVLHASAMVADAWASALTVLRPRDAVALAEREGLAARIVTEDGEEWFSAALLEML